MIALPLPQSFPRPLARLVARLPALPPSLAFAAACNRTAWPTLRELDWSPARGRRFRVHVRDMGLSIYLSVGDRGLKAERAGPVDVSYTASAEDFLRLALRLEDPDTLFFNRRLAIEGDTNLGLTMKNLLDAVDWDELARNMPLGLGRLLQSARQHIRLPAVA
ncbi:MAG: SCP2 sterol-binding domain-containing protein [Pseudomonadota bacterium]